MVENKPKDARSPVTPEQRLNDINTSVATFADVIKSATGKAPDVNTIKSYESKITLDYDKSHRVKNSHQMTDIERSSRNTCFDSMKSIKGFRANSNIGQKKLGTILDSGINKEVHLVFKKIVDKAGE